MITVCYFYYFETTDRQLNVTTSNKQQSSFLIFPYDCLIAIQSTSPLMQCLENGTQICTWSQSSHEMDPALNCHGVNPG